MSSVPALIVVAPLYALALLSVQLPVPFLMIDAAEIFAARIPSPAPASVMARLLALVNAPVLLRLRVPASEEIVGATAPTVSRPPKVLSPLTFSSAPVAPAETA